MAYCRWEEAVKLIYEGVAEVIKEDEVKEIHSPSVTMKMPRVIRVNTYITKPIDKKKGVSLTRNNIAIRDNHQCQYCGKDLRNKEQTLDHVIPQSKGGKSTWYNLVLCCKFCNSCKADYTLEESGMILRKIPNKPEDMILYQGLGHIRPEWADFQKDLEE
jgi:5-methylcytosine-specific restriction endonuclease McrA